METQINTKLLSMARHDHMFDLEMAELVPPHSGLLAFKPDIPRSTLLWMDWRIERRAERSGLQARRRRTAALKMCQKCGRAGRHKRTDGQTDKRTVGRITYVQFNG